MHARRAALLVWWCAGEAAAAGAAGAAPAQPRAEWTASIEGGRDVAQLVALQAGYLYVGEVLGFPDTYVLRKDEHAVSRRDRPPRPHAHLAADTRVRWAEQVIDTTRVKRYVIPDEEIPLSRVKRIEDFPLSRGNGTNDKRFPEKSRNRGKVGVTAHQGNREKRGADESEPLFNDELWSQEWYLQDTRTRAELPRLDLNVLPVYQAGINGAGVRVTVLDDGIEHQHSDLRDNYDPEISWDCNDGDPDPAPRNGESLLNSHGTRCAGEIAMAANNNKCGVGAAWGARIGGVRMLDGRVNDRVEGEALGFAWDKVDIYSASWGPNDDGRTVEGPGRLAQLALERGVTKGRNGKGAIFVWANGNGGSRYDNCNCDGYSSSIYTVSIGSASQHGRFPWYGETCPSTMAAAYSSGAYGDQKIATTDVKNSCTLKHTGTSAAAPLAAGVIALALQANPELSWRDVQHLLAWTSEQAPLTSGSGWLTNSAGLRFDVRFGFGVLNAAALVAAALNWTTVPDKTVCHVDALPLLNSTIQSDIAVHLMFPASECAVEYLEHAELVSKGNAGSVGAFTLVLHGTVQMPDHMKNGPRTFNDQYNYNFDGVQQQNYFDQDRTHLLETLHQTNNNFESEITDLTKSKQLTINTLTENIIDNDHFQNILNNQIDNIVEEVTPDNPTEVVLTSEEVSVYPLLNEFEKALLRVHHRMAKFSDRVQ